MQDAATTYNTHSQLQLRYALLKGINRELRFVDEVETGLKCNCVCPCCGKELVAKNRGQKKVHHFAHSNGADCKGARMTALHMLAQSILVERKQILLPAYEGKYYSRKSSLKTFDHVEGEETCKNEDSTRRPDCIGYNDGKTQNLWIEIYCQHKIDDAKREDIINRGQYCIEIDFSDLLKTDYTKEDVEHRLFEDSKHSQWICCPIWDNKEEQQRKEDEELQKQKLEERKKQIVAQREHYQIVSAESSRIYDVCRKWEVKKDDQSAEEVIQEIKRRPFPNGEGACICDKLIPQRRWLLFISNLPGKEVGRKVFYSVLHYYNQLSLFSGRNIEDLYTIERKLFKLTPNLQRLHSSDMIYFEYVIIIYTLHLINTHKQEDGQDSSLNKLLIANENVRQLWIKMIFKYGWRAISENNDTRKCIEKEVEDLDGCDIVVQIMRTCFPAATPVEQNGFDKELAGSDIESFWKEMNMKTQDN